jgi:hypothetical protein
MLIYSSAHKAHSAQSMILAAGRAYKAHSAQSKSYAVLPTVDTRTSCPVYKAHSAQSPDPSP